MNFHVLTLFPELIEAGMNTSITGRAIQRGILSLEAVNIRDFAFNKHQKVDDYPYGGGAGMLMQAEPVYLAYGSIAQRIAERQSCDESGRDCGKPMSMSDNLKEASAECMNTGDEPKETDREHMSPGEEPKNASGKPESGTCFKSAGRHPRVVYLTPQGEVFHQQMARELAQEEDLIFLCGHYEGIDERVLEEIVTDYVSIGDYVLTGGELAALVMMDSISRMVPGVLSNRESGETESFAGNLLEYPQYSRPEVWHGKAVPEVLLSGHHANIGKWRREQSVIRTAERRPDLLKKADLTNKEWNFVRELRKRWKEKASGEEGRADQEPESLCESKADSEPEGLSVHRMDMEPESLSEHGMASKPEAQKERNGEDL